MRILFLDDDKDLSETMRDTVEFMEGEHRDFIAVSNYKELLEHEEQALQSDLAILDINLGGDSRNGVDAADWLSKKHYSGKIVFLTGHAQSHPLVVKAAAREGIEVLEKPQGLTRIFELISG